MRKYLKNKQNLVILTHLEMQIIEDPPSKGLR